MSSSPAHSLLAAWASGTTVALYYQREAKHSLR